MKIHPLCRDCFRRQATSVAKLSEAEPHLEKALELWTENLVHCLPDDVPPSFIGRMIQRRAEDLTGRTDPFLTVRKTTNSFALELLNRFRDKLNDLDEPLIGALRLSAAGNIIDLGAKRNFTIEEAAEVVNEALSTPLIGADEAQAVERIRKAEKVLLIADNSGEIAFDRLLCEFIPSRPTVAVRQRPVLNDAVEDDARHVGMHEHADIITTGSDMPGAWLAACSEKFHRAFEQADVILSKGQGNYEGLSDVRFSGYFILRVKCELISCNTGFPIGRNLLVDASTHKSVLD